MDGLDYFYDGQIKRYLVQLVAVFHGFQYMTYDRNGNGVLRRAPVTWARTDRMTAHIQRSGSENTALSAPFITLHLSDIQHQPERRHNIDHIDKIQVTEREFDENLGVYTRNPGKSYTVERLMPVPYDMTVDVSTWTTNMEQKLQFFEQIGMVFNPHLDFQTSTNPLDWTALTTMHLQSITWSSRSIPIGTSTNQESLDIMVHQFLIPAWINPPAKVKRQQVIHQIMTNVANTTSECFAVNGVSDVSEDFISRKLMTPYDHRIIVEGNEVTLLTSFGGMYDSKGNLLKWRDLFNEYGNFRPGITQLRLKRFTTDPASEVGDIVGVVEIHPTEPNKLLWSVDPSTLPVNTLPAIDAVIDPHKTFPGSGLPTVANGQRYLLLDSVQPGTVAWGGLTADENDVIVYDNTQWQVAFDASDSTDQEVMLNNYTNKQLIFNPGEGWELAVDAEYEQGYWRLYF